MLSECIASVLNGISPAAYASAAPFPSAVVDGILTEMEARLTREAFPDRSWPGWKLHRNKNTDKRDCATWESFPPDVFRVCQALNSDLVVKALERMTGIHGLESDPFLEGGGMHLIGRGGFLGVHADFNIHTKTKKRRAVNLLLYLEEAEGGALELWDETAEHCVKTISTAPGRAAIFTAGDRTFHGHPNPLVAPWRRSIAAYYYLSSIDEAVPYHNTIYREVP